MGKQIEFLLGKLIIWIIVSAIAIILTSAITLDPSGVTQKPAFAKNNMTSEYLQYPAPTNPTITPSPTPNQDTGRTSLMILIVALAVVVVMVGVWVNRKKINY